MKVKIMYDLPTIEGMIYKDTIVNVDKDKFTERIHDEKVKGKTDTGKILWIPKKLLKKI
jgi:hypothetical protein